MCNLLQIIVRIERCRTNRKINPILSQQNLKCSGQQCKGIECCKTTMHLPVKQFQKYNQNEHKHTKNHKHIHTYKHTPNRKILQSC